MGAFQAQRRLNRDTVLKTKRRMIRPCCPIFVHNAHAMSIHHSKLLSMPRYNAYDPQ